MFDLIIEKLSEVLAVHRTLLHIDHRAAAAQLQIARHIQHRAFDIRQLADTAGFDDDAVRMELFQHLLQRLRKITGQRTADAPAVHLRDLHAGILQKTTVDPDLTKLIFDQYDLFVIIHLFEQLFDQRRLAGAEKTGNNRYLCHFDHRPFFRLLCIL